MARPVEAAAGSRPGAAPAAELRRLRRAARALYRGAPVADRLFVRGRLAILPLRDLLAYFPSEGLVLDVGCGRGVLANVLAAACPRLRIHGVELDARAVAVARATVRGRTNLTFEVADALALPARETYDAVAFIDVLHHLPRETHRRVLEGVRPLLRSGGTLIVKEIDLRPRWKYLWNFVHDLVVTRGQPLACRAAADLMGLVREAGYARVALHAIRSPFPYPHYAVTAVPDGGARDGSDP